MYEKRLCVLKQIKKGFTADGSQITGAIYAERLGGELILTPRIPALAPVREGRYALAIAAGGTKFLLELKGNEPLRVPANFSIKDGFSALLCFVRGEAEPIAFGACGSASGDYVFLLSLFEAQRQAPPTEEKTEIPEAAEECEEENEKYDDEAIADSNYYNGVSQDPENADAGCENPREAEAQGAGDCLCENEDGESVHPFERTRGTLAYYREIAPKLKEAMQRYPRDEHLQSVFPNSEWVKAESGLLGIIYREGLPKYLCVAMKSEPPEEVRDASVFVPQSPYSDDEGYFVVFQDADSGEYIKIEES